MRGRWVALAAAGTAGICLGVTASAGAATVTLGSPLTANFTTATANDVGTSAMVSGPNIAAPVDGTVISWRMQGFSGGPFRLRVLKLGSGNGTIGEGTGPPVSATGGLTEQTVNLPIKTGEVLGFNNGTATDRARLVQDSPTYVGAGWVPVLPDGGSPRVPSFNANVEFAYNATVRYCLVPDLAGKKLGVASQALTDAGCALGAVTKKKAKKKKKKKRKGPKIVRSQSIAAGTALADQAKVDVRVVIKKKKGKKKKK